MEKQVLIFDDDQDILDICRLILEARGYIVFTNVNCNQLFDKIREAAPAVILIDNQMPGLCGTDAIRLIKQCTETCDIPVVLISANADVQKLAADCSADYFLQKPFNMLEFENIVDELVTAFTVKRSISEQ